MFVETKIQTGHFFPLTADKLFCDLSPKSLDNLTFIKQKKRFQKRAFIYSAGEIPSGFYVLLRGRIQLQSNDLCAIHSIEPSAIFGLTETIAGVPYETTAETLTPCVCEYIGREDFISFLCGEPKFSFQLLRQLALDLQI